MTVNAFTVEQATARRRFTIGIALYVVIIRRRSASAGRPALPIDAPKQLWGPGVQRARSTHRHSAKVMRWHIMVPAVLPQTEPAAPLRETGRPHASGLTIRCLRCSSHHVVVAPGLPIKSR
jgi:hypothetical protein